MQVTHQNEHVIPDPDTKPPVPVVKSKQPPKQSKVAQLTSATHGEGSPKERIHKLLAIGITSVGVAKAILELKKKSKKSWFILGVNPTEVDQIMKLAQ